MHITFSEVYVVDLKTSSSCIFIHILQVYSTILYVHFTFCFIFCHILCPAVVGDIVSFLYSIGF